MTLLFKLYLKEFDCLFIQFISKIIPSIELEKRDHFTLTCSSKRVLEIILTLKNSTNLQFKSLTDVAGLDFIRNSFRLAVSYNLLSIQFNQRLRILAFLGKRALLPSITSAFKCSNWLEREVWDLFGIFFRFHPDLRRLLTNYGFEGHPLRKDFPLEGFFDCFYSFVNEGVVQEFLSFSSVFKKNVLKKN
jgi:NADH/F420H2 dehydrogenase subunit C